MRSRNRKYPSVTLVRMWSRKWDRNHSGQSLVDYIARRTAEWKDDREQAKATNPPMTTTEMALRNSEEAMEAASMLLGRLRDLHQDLCDNITREVRQDIATDNIGYSALICGRSPVNVCVMDMGKRSTSCVFCNRDYYTRTGQEKP